MESVGKRIKQVRNALGMSQVEFAKAIGVTKQTLYKYENDLITNIPSDKIEAAAKIGNITPAFLMGWTDDERALPPYANIHPIGKKRFPVLSEVACGEPILMQDEKELYVDASEDIKADFVLIAKGDSMTGAHIYDRDPVFIRAQQTVENGEIAAVGIGDEATLKRVYWYANRSVLVLKAENPDYPDMEFSGAELENIRIFGKAVMFQSRVR